MKKMLMMILVLGGLLFAVTVHESEPNGDSGAPPLPVCESDLDCTGINEVCENNVCVDAMSAKCGGKTCGEDEFLNSECECVPIAGGVISPCFGIVSALLAVVGFAIRNG